MDSGNDIITIYLNYPVLFPQYRQGCNRAPHIFFQEFPVLRFRHDRALPWRLWLYPLLCRVGSYLFFINHQFPKFVV